MDKNDAIKIARKYIDAISKKYQIELMCMRSDDDLLIEPHPYRISDFKISNPVVAEIMKNGIELKNDAA